MVIPCALYWAVTRSRSRASWTTTPSWKGRTQYDSPEVDQEILIPAAGRRLIRGCFYQVRITAAEDYDLYGELETK